MSSSLTHTDPRIEEALLRSPFFHARVTLADRSENSYILPVTKDMVNHCLNFHHNTDATCDNTCELRSDLGNGVTAYSLTDQGDSRDATVVEALLASIKACILEATEPLSQVSEITLRWREGERPAQEPIWPDTVGSQPASKLGRRRRGWSLLDSLGRRWSKLGGTAG